MPKDKMVRFQELSIDELNDLYPTCYKMTKPAQPTRHHLSVRKHYRSNRHEILPKLTLRRLAQEGRIPYTSTLKKLNKQDVINAWLTYLSNNTLVCHTKHRRTQVEKFQNYINQWVHDMN